MEPHPVPQNIIDVEFKLFGAFSLRQFGQILIGCMGGVAVYFIPFIPFIVKIPVIIIAVGAGLLSAFIPNFGTWMLGFVKALIIAPRYVWVKEPARSDILEASSDSAPTQVKTVSKAEKQENQLDNLVISGTENTKEDIFEDFLGSDNPKVKNENFNNMYNKSYDSEIQNINQVIAKQDMAIPEVSVQTKSEKPLTKDEILKEIELLKEALTLANREGNKVAETEVLNKINELYSKYKVMKGEDSSPKQRVQNMQMKQFLKNDEGKIIFGLVVTKNDKAISNATIIMTNSETKEEFAVKSGNDGKFATGGKIPFGSYDIKILHPNYKFHTYNIQINSGRLPAFKFREK